MIVDYVGVKFDDGGKVYYFSPDGEDLEKGDEVIVETSRGIECVTVVVPHGEVEENTLPSPMKPIIRKATAEDKETVRRNEARRSELMRLFTEKMEKYKLPMKLVSCEIAFEGNKVTYYFSSERRVDFRDFVRDLSSAVHMRIELRQIGIRDEIRMLGGIGHCGRECCCSGCMIDFKKVSVKMAKNQGLSLNPAKISGYCGRLMCCLAYEDYYYSETCKKMPKTGSEVSTPDGKGIVVNVDMLKMRVKVRIASNDYFKYGDYALDEVAPTHRPGGKPRAETKEDDGEASVGEENLPE
ncbi:MAG: stage 0 sporulation protein [Clostridia bacterium]|nr:stage 0 sporulation protein [Clostridia bacterium]